MLNPADYAYLRKAAELVEAASALPGPYSDSVVEAHAIEDRPRDDLLVEDSAALAELLGH